MTLLYPKWLPGTHSPTGPISKLDGLVITADGKQIPWVRDTVDVYAFHVDVPAGTKAIGASFKFLTPTAEAQGRILTTPDLLSLEWDSVSLYPAGYFVRDIPFSVSVTYPTGWKSATALAPGLSGDHVTYPTTDYETLVDSPAIAGRNMRSDLLAPGVHLDIAADRPDQLVATPEQIDAHKRLVQQAVAVFGAQHYDHYDFLLTLSDTLGGEGLEHHRSSEDGTGADYFTDWESNAPARNLLPHEFTHSWDGKFRRPADLWTPDYRTPMQDTLLWVYEGQTQYWGYILQARSGLVSKQDTLDALAMTAAYYQNSPAKAWRTVEDTTNDPTMSQRRPLAWRNYQWSEDYYEAGKLVWLDADQLIREKTGGKKSLDDFARTFFGVRDRDWGVLPYTFDDVVAALNKVMPYDWATFLNTRINTVAAAGDARLDHARRLQADLYRQAQRLSGRPPRSAARMPTSAIRSVWRSARTGNISGVSWGGPAFAGGDHAGLEARRGQWPQLRQRRDQGGDHRRQGRIGTDSPADPAVRPVSRRGGDLERRVALPDAREGRQGRDRARQAARGEEVASSPPFVLSEVEGRVAGASLDSTSFDRLRTNGGRWSPFIGSPAAAPRRIPPAR